MQFRTLLVAVAAVVFAGSAAAQVKIGLMVSATGPTSAIGIPQRNTADLLPKKIGDTTIEYIQLEDGGDSTRAVQNARKLIAENNIDALIGPSTTPNALRHPRHHRRGQGPADGDRGHVVGCRAGRRQAPLGVQDHAERRSHRRRADRATWSRAT